MNSATGNDGINRKSESSWLVISAASGVLLSLVYAFAQRFPEANLIVVTLVCCTGFYVLSILLRIQNHRGEFWLGNTILREGRLKIIFPIVGFVFGIALLVF